MTTTTNYGTWLNHHPDGDTAGTASIEDYVASALSDFASHYNLSGLIAAYRAGINDALPEDVSLHGQEFIGPYPTRENAGQEIHDAIDSVDFWALAAKYDLNA